MQNFGYAGTDAIQAAAAFVMQSLESVFGIFCCSINNYRVIVT
jgi:hypothetical protein